MAAFPSLLQIDQSMASPAIRFRSAASQRDRELNALVITEAKLAGAAEELAKAKAYQRA
jgi:hypothetical protein